MREAKWEDDVHKPQLLKRKESRSGESNRHRLLSSLSPYRWAKPSHTYSWRHFVALYKTPLSHQWRQAVRKPFSALSMTTDRSQSLFHFHKIGFTLSITIDSSQRLLLLSMATDSSQSRLHPHSCFPHLIHNDRQFSEPSPLYPCRQTIHRAFSTLSMAIDSSQSLLHFIYGDRVHRAFSTLSIATDSSQSLLHFIHGDRQFTKSVQSSALRWWFLGGGEDRKWRMKTRSHGRREEMKGAFLLAARRWRERY